MGTMGDGTSLGARRDYARGLNDDIATGLAHPSTDAIDVLCECGGVDCSQWITVPHGTYTRVRRMERWLVVANGHEVPDVDRVASRHESFALVEPIAGPNGSGPR